MDSQIEFFVHPMCPYAERGILVQKFKGIECSVVEVDLGNKTEDFLSVNPRGTVPAVRVTKGGKTFNLYESLVIADYFDTFPGPGLYPRNPDGSVNEEEKALIRLYVVSKIDAFPALFYKFYSTPCTPDNVEDIRKYLTELNDTYLAGGQFYMHSILGRNEVTMTDVILLPYIERLHAYKDETYRLIVEGIDLSNVWAWYNTMLAFDWVQASKVSDKILNNFKNKVSQEGRQPLSLPISIYDY